MRLRAAQRVEHPDVVTARRAVQRRFGVQAPVRTSTSAPAEQQHEGSVTDEILRRLTSLSESERTETAPKGHIVRKLIVTEFVTLDGVMEAPGGEPTHPHTGWVGDYFGDEVGAYKEQEIFDADVHLIGRVTYESFAGAWP